MWSTLSSIPIYMLHVVNFVLSSPKHYVTSVSFFKNTDKPKQFTGHMV